MLEEEVRVGLICMHSHCLTQAFCCPYMHCFYCSLGCAFGSFIDPCCTAIIWSKIIASFTINTYFNFQYRVLKMIHINAIAT